MDDADGTAPASESHGDLDAIPVLPDQSVVVSPTWIWVKPNVIRYHAKSSHPHPGKPTPPCYPVRIYRPLPVVATNPVMAYWPNIEGDALRHLDDETLI